MFKQQFKVIIGWGRASPNCCIGLQLMIIMISVLPHQSCSDEWQFINTTDSTNLIKDAFKLLCEF